MEGMEKGTSTVRTRYSGCSRGLKIHTLQQRAFRQRMWVPKSLHAVSSKSVICMYVIASFHCSWAVDRIIVIIILAPLGRFRRKSFGDYACKYINKSEKLKCHNALLLKNSVQSQLPFSYCPPPTPFSAASFQGRYKPVWGILYYFHSVLHRSPEDCFKHEYFSLATTTSFLSHSLNLGQFGSCGSGSFFSARSTPDT